MRRTRPAARPVDHNSWAAAQRTAAADSSSAPATPGSHSTRYTTRSRAPRQHARAALDRSTRPGVDGGGTGARSRDRSTDAQARTATTRAARRRTARRRPTRPLLVTSRPHQSGSRLRTPRRRRPDPRLLRPDRPLPARPKRRPQTQPRAPHDPCHPQTPPPADDRLHRTPTHRRQDTTRSKPLPQALPRPQPLPPTRTRTADRDLTNIEASLWPRLSVGFLTAATSVLVLVRVAADCSKLQA